jgi:hypothetical protein
MIAYKIGNYRLFNGKRQGIIYAKIGYSEGKDTL